MNDEIYHYGVLGMKWGVRKDRYSGKLHKYDKQKESKESEEHAEAKRIGKKSLDQMSNAEIRKLNERMQLENQNKQLLLQRRSAGKKYIDDTAANVRNQATSTITQKAITVGAAVAAGFLVAKLSDRNIDLRDVSLDILDPTKKKKK